MGKYAQLIVGPAGVGKTTYCATLLQHLAASGRTAHVVNLDPAARHLPYEPAIDVRELVSLEDVMAADDVQLGPNGGLVFCFEFLLANLDWLLAQLGDFADDYLLLDAPGQIELYSHMPLMRRLVRALDHASYRVCSVYLLDSTFLSDPVRFASGALSALSAMMRLETTHVNVLSKMDQVKQRARRQRVAAARAARAGGAAPSPFSAAAVSSRAMASIGVHDRADGDDADAESDNDDGASDDGGFGSAAVPHADADDAFDDEGWQREQYDRELEKFFYVDVERLAADLDDNTPPKMRSLNRAIGGLLDEFSLVQFVPLDITSELSIESLLERVDTSLQYDEDQEVQIPHDVDEEDGVAPLGEQARFVA